ncbi:MAG: N-acetyltransferase [Bacteroidales bacterium]|nr:N-acetyltransferase [Bacteroidales bacterium]
MNPIIRQEKFDDHKAVFTITELAFRNLEISEHNEQFLVDRLRKSSAFIPELSMVAEIEGKIVGHILLTKILIKNEKSEHESLTLAPVSVHPDFQKMGIGAKLIQAAHQKARELGYKSVVLIGHPHYYPRFGYRKASDFGIKFHFDAPDEVCMAVELVPKGFNGVNGFVELAKEFFEN